MMSVVESGRSDVVGDVESERQAVGGGADSGLADALAFVAAAVTFVTLWAAGLVPIGDLSFGSVLRVVGAMALTGTLTAALTRFAQSCRD